MTTKLAGHLLVECLMAQGVTHAERVQSTADFEPALRRALAAEQGTLIELTLDVEIITTRSTLSANLTITLQGE